MDKNPLKYLIAASAALLGLGYLVSRSQQNVGVVGYSIHAEE